MIDLEDRIRATLTRVADETTVPTLPPFDDTRRPDDRSRRRRLAMGVATSCLVLGAGVAVAAAGGTSPSEAPIGHDGFGSAVYSWDSPSDHARPGTVRRVLTVAVEGGNTLRLDLAEAGDADHFCVRLSDANGEFGTGTQCPSTAEPFGSLDGGGALGHVTADGTEVPGRHEFAMHVPGATSARIEFDDGTTTGPLPVADDETVGVISGAQTLLNPVLVGYDAAGAVVGRAPVVNAVEQRQILCNWSC